MTHGEVPTLAKRTLSGLIWSYSSFVGGRVLVLVTTAILARVLVPSEFGLVALALTFIALLDTLSDFGVSQALVIVDEDSDEKAETVFAISILAGGGLALVTCATGYPLAQAFDEPALTAIMPALGLNLLLRSFGATHFAIAQKQMDFRSRTRAELSDVIARGAVGIAFALAGFGAWSLVLGYLAGSITFTLALFLMVPWRPKLKPRRAHVRELVGFGGALTGVNVLAAVIANVDYIVVAAALGTTALGVYSLAFRLPELLVLNLSVVASHVLFPAFATLDREGLGRAFLTSLRYSLILALPLAVTLGVLAAPIIEIAFGSQWTDSVDPMRLIAIYACSIAIGIPAGSAYKATGRAKVLLWLAIPRTILIVVLALLVVDRGIVAIALSQAAVAVLFDGIGSVIATRLLDVGLRRMLASIWAPFVASLGLAAALVSVDLLVGPALLKLIVAGFVGGSVYLLLLSVLMPDVVSRLTEAIRARKKNGPP